MEASVDNDIVDLITARATAKDGAFVTKYEVKMRRRIYDFLNEKGHYCYHEGFRHVNLLDANRLEFQFQANYDRAKRIVKDD